MLFFYSKNPEEKQKYNMHYNCFHIDKISILLMKDHVTLKTGVMADKYSFASQEYSIF